MKKLLNNRISHLLFLSMMLIITMLTSCNNDDDSNGAPVITTVRNYAPAPNDTLVTSIVPGQWIVLHGKNLKEATQISFNGTPIDFDAGLFSDKTAVLQVPLSLPFNNLDPDVVNTIKYVTAAGTTTYKFNVIPPAATITGNSMTSATKVGDSIYVYGTNLYLIEKLTIAGMEISPLKTADDGSSVGFVLPTINAPMPWATVLVAASRTYEFDVLIVPEIYAVSNANPSQGDLIRVVGKNLNGVSSLSFAGATITDYTEDPDGLYVEFLAPAMDSSHASGPVTIVSTYGTVITPYNVHTLTYLEDGVIMNFEGGWSFNGMEGNWGNNIKGAVNNAANDPFGWLTHTTDFDGALGTNNTLFPYYKQDEVFNPGQGGPNWDGHAFLMGENQWIPSGNLSDPVGNWAIQFEMSIPKPLDGVSICFRTDFAGDSYLFRFEPWRISASVTAAYKTEGWQTVTIPLTEFRAKIGNQGEGRGASVTSLTQLLGSTGKANLKVFAKNFGTTPSKTGFYGAFDNIRIVKIK